MHGISSAVDYQGQFAGGTSNGSAKVLLCTKERKAWSYTILAAVLCGSYDGHLPAVVEGGGVGVALLGEIVAVEEVFEAGGGESTDGLA